MSILIFVSKFIVPFVILYIVMYGMACRLKIYDEFVNGAKEGLNVVKGICPVLVGLMVATGMLRRSGVLEAFIGIAEPLLGKVSFPSVILPLILVKLFSSSAATSLLIDVYKEFGTDSYEGLLGSVCLASSETVFYTLSIYFASERIIKTRWALPGALLATVSGTVASVWIVGFLVS